MIASLSASRMRRRIAITIVCVVAVLWSTAVVYTLLRREAFLDDARDRVVMIASIGAAQNATMIEMADLLLRQGRHVVRDIDDPMPALDDPRLEQASQRLTELAGASSFIRNLSLARADGQRIATARAPGGPSRSVAGQPHHEIHRTERMARPFISGIVRSWEDERPLILVSRRVETSSGIFAGTVWASLDARALSRAQAGFVAARPETTIDLYDAAGTILARSEASGSSIGRSPTPAEGFTGFGPPGRAGSGRMVMPPDGVDRIVAWMPIPGVDLTLVVGESTAAALSPWRIHLGAVTLTLVALTALALVLGMLLDRALGQIDTEHRDLVAARLDAETAYRSKSEFLAAMSHEVRTPLSGIAGYTDILLGRIQEPELRRLLAVIRDASGSLRSLVDDVLDIARIEDGRVALVLEPLMVEDLVRSSIAIVEVMARERGTRIECRIAADVPSAIRGDRERIRQALLNLLSNAVKFTAHGTIHVSVERVPQDGAEVVLRFRVDDSGTGVPADALSRLFGRFEQATSSVAREGVGLGLSIVRGLAKAMGGDVGAESAAGRGSSFWFTIRSTVATAPSTLVAAGTSEPADIRNVRVLVADDMRMNRELIELLLRPLGAAVESVPSGDEAVARVAAGGIDVVLMDLQMPGVDGIQATRRIRALSGPPRDVPIIALSASVLAADVARCREAGMDEHLPKPIDVARITETIARFARQRASDLAPRRPSTADIAGPTALDGAVLADLERRIGRDQVVALVDSFLQEIDSAVPRLRRRLRAIDDAGLAAIAHGLRSMALNIGAAGLAESLRRLEAEALKPQPRASELEHLVADVALDVVATREAIGRRPSDTQGEAASESP